MLKQDEHLQETIFGHLNAASKEGGGNKGKGGIEEMGPDDRLAMLRMGLNKHMNNILCWFMNIIKQTYFNKI